MKDSADRVQNIFNAIAPEYDRLNNWLSLGGHHIWKLMTVKWCEPQKGDRGLDLCCGSGDLAILLAKRIGNGEVIGVDFSCQLLEVASQKQAKEIIPLPLTWMEADVLELPFSNNYFNCATMGYGLRNVIDIPRCLQELHRVLQPRAKAAILDFHRPKEASLRTFQQWYLDNIVVPMARNFGLTEEYAYISPSLERFPTGDKQVGLALEAGFSHAIHYPIANGMMGVLVVTK
jgi:demethylmenaquinone methyltransferase/2-methoxy-6-polyprenyl-1,4-benzoquinol methylase